MAALPFLHTNAPFGQRPINAADALSKADRARAFVGRLPDIINMIRKKTSQKSPTAKKKHCRSRAARLK